MLIALGSGRASADSLVTNEGQIFLGEVQKTDSGYSVKTKDGTVQVKAEDVRTVLLDHRPPAVTQNSSPAVPKAPRAAKPTDVKTLAISCSRVRTRVRRGVP